MFDRPVIGPIGIDFGAHRVRLIQLASLGGRLEVIAASETPTPPVGVPCGAAGGMLAGVRAMMASGGFRGDRVVLAVSHSLIKVKNFRLPIIPEEELEQAVLFEASERFQSLDGNPEVRFFNAGRVESAQGPQCELIVAAVRGDTLDAMLTAADEAKLEVDAIDFAPAAMFRPFERFLKREEDAGQINAFLDLGQGGSRLVITQGDEIAFAKTLDIGCAAFQSAIGSSLSVGADEAAELFALSMRTAEPSAAGATDERLPAVWQALAAPIEQLGKEIGLCLRYYSVTFRGLRPDGITCVGGGARHGGVLERLTAVIGAPVVPGHPLRGVHCATVLAGPDRRSGQPEWATAAGLAMRGFVPKGDAKHETVQPAVAS